MNWSVTFVVLTLFAIVWLFVTAVAVGLEEGSASRELRQSMYVALVVVVVSGVAAAVLSF